MRRYFGSVRFFKHLIFGFIFLCILLSTGLCLQYQQALDAAKADLAQARAETAAASAELSRVREEVAAAKAAEAEQAALSAQVPAYQSLYPDFYAPQALTADEAPEQVMYLTFNSAPSARTAEILRILREEEVPATFFVTASDSPNIEPWLRDIAAEGHTVGMLSYSHQYRAIYDSVEAYLVDMYRIFTLIRDTTGTVPTVFRFPGGSINGHNYAIYQELLAEMLRRGFVPWDWNVSGGDTAASVTAEQIVSNITESAAGQRCAALLHDGASQTATVTALRPIITKLRENGCTFAALTPEVKPILFGSEP